MIVEYLDLFVFEFLPDFFLYLNSIMIAENVSFLGLIVAVTLLSVVIGSVLMRVS